MHEKISPVNFLIGFLAFFIWFAIVFGFAAKFGNTPISKRKERKKQDIFFLCIYLGPIVAFFVYISPEILKFIIPVAGFMLFYEFVIQRPRLNSYITRSEALYKTLLLKGQEARYSFDPEKATILLHWDVPAYIDGNLYDLRIDRVCKNEYGEYFWVKASLKGFFSPDIKLLSIDGAKNLLRQHRDIYLQEFNEEPYYKSK